MAFPGLIGYLQRGLFGAADADRTEQAYAERERGRQLGSRENELNRALDLEKQKNEIELRKSLNEDDLAEAARRLEYAGQIQQARDQVNHGYTQDDASQNFVLQQLAAENAKGRELDFPGQQTERDLQNVDRFANQPGINKTQYGETLAKRKVSQARLGNELQDASITDAALSDPLFRSGQIANRRLGLAYGTKLPEGASEVYPGLGVATGSDKVTTMTANGPQTTINPAGMSYDIQPEIVRQVKENLRLKQEEAERRRLTGKNGELLDKNKQDAKRAEVLRQLGEIRQEEPAGILGGAPDFITTPARRAKKYLYDRPLGNLKEILSPFNTP